MNHSSAKLPQFLILGLIFFSVVTDLFADELDVINLFAGRSEIIDSNLFRLPGDVDPFPLVGGHERSDRIADSYAGIVIEKPIGLQKLHFDSLYSSYSYQNFSYLNANTSAYLAKWQWSISPELIGTLSDEKKQIPLGFMNTQTYSAQNIVTSENRIFHADWSPLGNWHMLSTLTDATWLNSQLYSQYASSESKTVEEAIQYVYPSGTSLEVLHRKTRGIISNATPDFVYEVNSNFAQEDTQFVLVWPINGKSLVNAMVGYEKRNVDLFPDRDYAGQIGSFSYTNELTGKFLITASASRSFVGYQDIYSSYYVSTDESIQAKWAPLSKTVAILHYDTTKNDFYGQITPSVRRDDRTRATTFELDWKPDKWVWLIEKTIWQKRDSSYANWVFADTTSSLTLQLNF